MIEEVYNCANNGVNRTQKGGGENWLLFFGFGGRRLFAPVTPSVSTSMKYDMSRKASEDEEIATSIHKHGWHAISVDASAYTPRFLYTIGLMETYDHPEVIVFGCDPQFAHTLLCHLVDDVKNGTTYVEEGRYDGLLEGIPIAIRHVHPTQHIFYFGYALGHARYRGKIGHLKAVQLLWPDKAGTFPFETGCDDDVYRLQPRLDLEVPVSEQEEFYREYGYSS